MSVRHGDMCMIGEGVRRPQNIGAVGEHMLVVGTHVRMFIHTAVPCSDGLSIFIPIILL